MKPKVIILGRPNVGKSALFNRLVIQRKAIVHEQSGVTRDLLMADTDWNGRSFTVVDSGGLDFRMTDEIAGQVQQKARQVIEEADLVLFVVDARDGPQPLDAEISRLLHRAGRPVLLVVNKVDSYSLLPRILDFHNLGWEEPIGVSGLNSFNVGDLLDLVVEMLPAVESSENSAGVGEEIGFVGKVAIVGRPNVGKSSILNALLGEERAIVSTIPGTTRDVVDSVWQSLSGPMLLVDTAGIRRKSKVYEDVEYYSVLRAKQALERADLAILVLDAADGILGQDRKIAGLISDLGKACVIAVNKVDLIDLKLDSWDNFQDYLHHEFDFLAYAETLPISAKTGWNMELLPSKIQDALLSYQSQFSTGLLNRIFGEITEAHPPPSSPGKEFKIFYVTQKKNSPPLFLCFVNKAENLHFSYERYIKNELIAKLDLHGTPVRLEFRSRERKELSGRPRKSRPK